MNTSPNDIAIPGLLAVDATNVLYRCFHAMHSSGMSHAGRPVWAVYGLVTYLAKWIRLVRPDDVVLAFDQYGGCPFRRALLPSYKAARPAPATSLAYQLDWAPSLCRQLGFSAVQFPGWEADDLLASAVSQYKVQRDPTKGIVVVSSDRDLYQLVSPVVSVLSPDGTWTTESALHERLGLTPLQYAQVAALRGEPGDGIPGVPGVGPKKAAALVKEFGSVAGILSAPPENVRRIVGPSVAESIVAHGPTALLALEVASLNPSLPVDLSVSQLSRINPAQVVSVCNSSGLARAGELLRSALELA